MYEYGVYCLYSYIPIKELYTRCLAQLPPPPFFPLYLKLSGSGHISGMCLIISTHRGLISYFVEGNMTVSWLKKFTFTKGGGRTKDQCSVIIALNIFVRKTMLAEPTQYRMAVKDTQGYQNLNGYKLDHMNNNCSDDGRKLIIR